MQRKLGVSFNRPIHLFSTSRLGLKLFSFNTNATNTSSLTACGNMLTFPTTHAFPSTHLRWQRGLALKMACSEGITWKYTMVLIEFVRPIERRLLVIETFLPGILIYRAHAQAEVQPRLPKLYAVYNSCTYILPKSSSRLMLARALWKPSVRDSCDMLSLNENEKVWSLRKFMLKWV